MKSYRVADLRRVLLIRLKGLGDVVQALPLLQALARAYPHIEFGFLTLEAWAPLLQTIPEKIALFTLPGKGRTLARIRAFQPDLVVDLFGTPRTALLSLLSGAPHRFGFEYRVRRYLYTRKLAVTRPDLHISALFLETLRWLGFHRLRPWVFDLSLPPPSFQAKKVTLALPHPLVGLNPNAAYQAKKWLTRHFLDLARFLLEAGYSVALMNGPGEEAHTARLYDALGPHPKLFWFKNPDLLSTLGLIAGLDLLVTNDSGPLHLAGAVGTPVYALFGPTNPRANGPLGSEDRVFRAEKLACLVCHREFCPHQRCMVELNPRDLFVTIRDNFPPRGLK